MTDSTAARPAWRENIVPLSTAIVLAVLAIFFRGDLIRWFTGEPTSGDTSEEIRLEVGNLQVELALRPNRPRRENNAIELSLHTADGKPVAGAELAVTLSMPPMGQMAEMRATAAVRESAPGRYRATYDLAMDGSWTLDLSVKSAAGSIEARYTLIVGAPGLVLVESNAGGGPKAPTNRFSDATRASVVRALAAYETIRSGLAADQADKVEPPSRALADALSEALAAVDSPAGVLAEMGEARAAAETLAVAGTLEDARAAFAALSRPVLALAAFDSRVAENLHAFECPMTKGFNKWLQPNAPLKNPYMGPEMLTCGSEVELPVASGAGEGHGGHDHTGGDAIDYYTCPMETWVKEKKPGTCPVCGMDLVSVTVEEVRTGALRVDHRRRQLIGLKTAKIERRQLTARIKAVGRVAYDETRIADVTVRTAGFVKGLRVEALGERVRRGQRLFSLYSPDLYSAQKELILATSQARSATSDAGRARAATLLRGARQRLRLWGIGDATIEKIASSGEALEYIPINSPASGFVVEKGVVEGASVSAGARLFRIADLDEVWVEADIYEQDLAQIAVGQSAIVSLTHRAGKSYRGEVSFIYPYLDNESRTARVRIELPNKGLELKPDMYADVELSSTIGERLAVPEQAVIYSGPRRIVFVDAGEDKLVPHLIRVGVKTDGFFEVLSGLREGDLVVTSGNFLLSAESRLKAATGLW